MTDLTPMQNGRLQAALDRLYRESDGTVRALRDWIKAQPECVLSTSDGMIDYNRRTFNRMDQRQQDAYMAKLRARRYFYINDRQVPKMVYDFVAAFPGAQTCE